MVLIIYYNINILTLKINSLEKKRCLFTLKYILPQSEKNIF